MFRGLAYRYSISGHRLRDYNIGSISFILIDRWSHLTRWAADFT